MAGIGVARIVPRSGGGGGGPIPAGAWVPWDALVSNQLGIGDYASISAACAAEPNNSIIAVDSNPTTPYVEVANIQPKPGQVIFAFDGIRDGGQVNIRMGDFRVIVANPDVIFEGIYFDWDAMTIGGNYMFDVSGAGCMLQRVTLDMRNAGLPLNNNGVRLGGGSHQLDKVQILLNDGSLNPLRIQSGTNWLNEVTVIGSNDNIRMVDCVSNRFVNCSFQTGVFGGSTCFEELNTLGPLAANNEFVNCRFQDSGGLGRAYTQALDGTRFVNCTFIGNANGGLLVTTTGVNITSCDFSVAGTYGVQFNGAEHCNLTNCTFEVGTNAISIVGTAPNPAQYIAISNCSVRPGAANAGSINISGGRYIEVSQVNFPADGISIQANGGFNSVDVTLVSLHMNGLTVAGVGTDGVSEFGCFFSGGITDTSNALQRGVRTHISVNTPTANDDSSDGFIAGISRWFCTSNQVEYLCHADGVGAAAWVPAGTQAGRAPWDYLVHPSAGYGDYTSIGLACNGAPVDSVIAVAPGVYTEPGNIQPRQGQVVFGLTGQEDNIQVNFTATGRIITNGIRAKIQGIYFRATRALPADDVAILEIGHSEFEMVDCTLDLTPTAGAQQHRAIRVTAAVSNIRLENVTIRGDSVTYRPFSANTVIVGDGTLRDSIIRNLRITGCRTTVVADEDMLINLGNPERNIWEDINIDRSGTTSVQQGSVFYIYNTTGAALEGNTYNNIFLKNDALAADGHAIYYATNGVAPLINPDKWTNLTIEGFYDAITMANHDGVSFVGFSIIAYGNRAFGGMNQPDRLMLVNGFVRGQGSCYFGSGSEVKIDNCEFVNTTGGGAAAVIAQTAPNWCVSNTRFTGDYQLLSGDGQRFTNCEFEDDLELSAGVDNVLVSSSYINLLNNLGADRILVASSYVAAGTTGNGALSLECAFTGCRIQNHTVSQGTRTLFSACVVDGTLTNSANAINTRISSTTFGTFGDAGQDTVRDVYTQETLGGAGPFSIRGSREYDNTGLGVGSTIALPDPAAVQVSIGYRFRVVVTVAQTITISQPALQVIHINGTSSTAGAGGNASSNVLWSILELEYKGNNNWVAVAMLGTWTLV